MAYKEKTGHAMTKHAQAAESGSSLYMGITSTVGHLGS